jgi:hypothetical protein
VKTDLAELRTQMADVQKKVALGLGVVAGLFVLFKVGRTIWRRTRD